MLPRRHDPGKQGGGRPRGKFDGGAGGAHGPGLRPGGDLYLQRLFSADLATITRLKEENPSLVAGLVEPPVSILPEEFLAAGPQLDFVARREFDYTILELAQGQPVG